MTGSATCGFPRKYRDVTVGDVAFLLCCCLYLVVSVLSSLCYGSDVLFCSGKLSFINLEFKHRFI